MRSLSKPVWTARLHRDVGQCQYQRGICWQQPYDNSMSGGQLRTGWEACRPASGGASDGNGRSAAMRDGSLWLRASSTDCTPHLQPDKDNCWGADFQGLHARQHCLLSACSSSCGMLSQFQ